MARRRLTDPVTWIGLAIVVLLGTGSAVAATGGTFILGEQNSATTLTSLTNTSGTALKLTSKAGTPPLAVSNDTKVAKLNSDEVDGIDGQALQRKIQKLRYVPANVTGSTAPKELFTINGIELEVRCLHLDGFDLPDQFRFEIVFSGDDASMHGHMARTLAPDGGPPGTVTSAIDREVTPDPDDLGAQVQFGDRVYWTWTLYLVQAGAPTAQVVMHALLDGTDASDDAMPCSLWGTVI